MTVNGKQLGQLRPANTTAASIYSPAVSTETQVTAITVCNTSGTVAKMRIFHDDSGTTYDEESALYWDVEVAVDDTITISFDRPLFMNNSAGNLAVRTDTASALTFTVWGLEKT